MGKARDKRRSAIHHDAIKECSYTTVPLDRRRLSQYKLEKNLALVHLGGIEHITVKESLISLEDRRFIVDVDSKGYAKMINPAPLAVMRDIGSRGPDMVKNDNTDRINKGIERAKAWNLVK